jgi:hypothetical protein
MNKAKEIGNKQKALLKNNKANTKEPALGKETVQQKGEQVDKVLMDHMNRTYALNGKRVRAPSKKEHIEPPS